MTERQYRAREKKATEQWRREQAMPLLVEEAFRHFWNYNPWDHSNDGPYATGGIAYWITTNVEPEKHIPFSERSMIDSIVRPFFRRNFYVANPSAKSSARHPKPK